MTDSELQMPEATPEIPEEAPKNSLAKKWARDIFDVLELFTFCAAVILVLFTFVFRLTVVDGASMEDTLLEGDYLLVQEIGYTPAVGDIVVVQDVSLSETYKHPLVKRVIAVAGQTVDIDFTTWTLRVDGEIVEEPYRKLVGPTLASSWTYPITVPEGCVFVMGDNRNESADSRISAIGMIDERCVIGRAVLRLFPLSRIDILE